MKTLTTKQREKIKKLANDLNDAFVWSKTKQGCDYWLKINDELLELLKETKCPTCRHVIKE